MSTQTWTVAEAKAKFSELIDKAKSEGPQKITKHGRTTAVVGKGQGDLERSPSP
jgi:antitoxin (DNA-binding transcriptional repressor) of toxin-antitoxin stability system